MRFSKKEARDFKRRWHKINARGRQELRQMSLAQKALSLGTLMASFNEFQRGAEDFSDDGEVRRRWNRLRQAHHEK